MEKPAKTCTVIFNKLKKMVHLVGFTIEKCTIYLIKVKVKVKFTLEQATRAQKGRRGIALLYL
jgi:hypothetical protein